MRGVDQHGDRGADAELLDEDDLRGREGADRDAEEQRRGGDDAARSARGPIATASRSDGAVVARLLDPRQQEDAVVGGEAEGDGEQQDRLRLTRARPGSCSRAGPRSGRPGRSAPAPRRSALSVSRFISSALIGSTTEPVIRNRTMQRRERRRSRARSAGGREARPAGRRSAAVCAADQHRATAACRSRICCTSRGSSRR